MTDLRARLTDALLKSKRPAPDPQWAERAADVLLSLPGIAIVELPEGHDVGQGWLQFKNVVAGPDGHILDETGVTAVKHNAATARRYAACLLAAANAAEETP